MPAAATPSSRSEDEDPVERNRALLLSLGVLVLVSAVIAAVVIVSGGGSARPAKEPVAQVRTSGQSLLVGNPDASTKVEVEEDFGSPQSRAFDLASRDFLRIEAALGKVLVTYRPTRTTGGYGQEAMSAWSAATDTGDPERAQDLHDRLFDRQPAGATPAIEPQQRAVVRVDGERLTAADGTELADQLQRRLLED